MDDGEEIILFHSLTELVKPSSLVYSKDIFQLFKTVINIKMVKPPSDYRRTQDITSFLRSFLLLTSWNVSANPNNNIIIFRSSDYTNLTWYGISLHAAWVICMTTSTKQWWGRTQAKTDKIIAVRQLKEQSDSGM